MAPVLTEIAAEFGITAGTAGLVVAAYGVPGMVLGVFAGPYSDRFGRKPLLVGGSLLLGIGTILAAFAPSFPVLVLTRTIAGAGSSVIFPNVNATVGDSFPYRERGRALSIVIALNTIASVVGIPISGILAEQFSWRLSLGLTGVLVGAATVVLVRVLREDRPTGAPGHAGALFRTFLRTPSAVALMVSSLFGALFWMTWSTYVVVFFAQRYGLSIGVASTVALTGGLGILVGSLVGGRLGDRIGHRLVVYRTNLVAALILLFVTNVLVPLPVAAVLVVVLSGVMGMRFATNSALLSEAVPAARGTVAAVHSSLLSAALVGGAAVGGVLIDGPGFGTLGVACFIVAVCAGLTMVLFVKEKPIDLEVS